MLEKTRKKIACANKTIHSSERERERERLGGTKKFYTIVGIYTANHLSLPMRYLLKMMLLIHLDFLVVLVKYQMI